MALKVFSKSFQDGGMIPKQYTCDGKNISPHLAWAGMRDDAVSMAMIMEDPMAPHKVFTHWVVFNIPAKLKEIPENVSSSKNLSIGAKQGTNDFGKIGYGGPCPPTATHKYYFRFYILDTLLDLEPGVTKEEVLEAIKDHILEEAQIMGKYRR